MKKDGLETLNLEILKGAMESVLKGDSLKLGAKESQAAIQGYLCLLYTSPSPRDRTRSRMPSSA